MPTQREQEMRALLAEQEASGLSIREFTKLKGLRRQSFYWWRRRIREKDKEPTTADLVEVKIENPSALASVRIELLVKGDEVRLSVPSGFAVVDLQRVINALRQC